MENDQSKGCCNWRTTGKVLGYMWIVIAIIGILYMGYRSKITFFDVVTFAFDISTAIFWLHGIATNQSVLMLIGLICSGIQTAMGLFMVIVYIIIVGSSYGIKDDSETNFVLSCVLLIFIIVAVLIVLDFALTFICYKKIKEDIQKFEISTFNVTFAPATIIKC